MKSLFNREQIKKSLTEKKLIFTELNSRMNYGCIGWLSNGDKRLVTIFQSTFYVVDKEFPINTDNLELISSIQKEFAELTRDDKNRIITLENLTITKGRFLEWYYEKVYTEESNQLRLDLAKSIIDQMFKTGSGSMSVQEIFDNCNQEAIRLYFTEQYDMQTDEYDIELIDFKKDYTISLVE